ncbi:ANKRD17 [Symbiodinium sp. CCMP2456]|nr:ANKRD17 [Symbiodinium sp. CCMP2456]
MACCASGKFRTPLEIHARSLPDEADAASMLFPMYTVASEILLKMTKVEPHEELKARGELTVFSEYIGRAAFVSHQWLAKHHPDPDFKQMHTLQGAVRQLLRGRGCVSLDGTTESIVRTAKPFPMDSFQVEALFFWYDYFSCPQRRQHNDGGDGSQQAHAIGSIPAYVARSHFFLALCPVLDCPLEAKVLSVESWSSRAWCRLERAARELSPEKIWILIESETSIQTVGTALSFPTGPVGEGDFTIEDDRQKVAPVLRKILMHKLNHCLRMGDLPAFRRHFNLQTVHLRGLEIPPVGGMLSSCEGDGNVVTEFLHQNGLRNVREADSAGWRPLHYAALAGNLAVLRGLLEQRADVNWRTSKDEPMLGFPIWMSALDLATFFKHHEATQLLLTARAHLEGGLAPSLNFAASSDNVQGIRLLCQAGGKPLGQSLLGISSFEAATSSGATGALEELMLQACPGSLSLSRALWFAAASRGGSAELVHRLIGLRADINFQVNLRRDFRRLNRLFLGLKSLEYQMGRTTVLATVAYHMDGSTPLMHFINSSQFEGAAALIAAGAKLDIRNCRNWTAADFAKGRSIPDFLQLGLEGDRSECRRVFSLALADGYVEVPF